MATYETRHQAYLISTDPDRIDLDVVHRWLSEESYWAEGRSRDTVVRSVAGSLNFGAYTRDGSMAGYARVVTDEATFAWICDVFVLDEHRGRGLGKAMMDAVMEHPGLDGMQRMLLATADAHSLYARYGFEPMGDPEGKWMIKEGPAI